MLRFTLAGVPPPKKNSRRIFTNKGKIVNLPSERHAAWHDRVWLEIPHQQFHGPVTVTVRYWMPDNRRRDLSNLTESLMDELVDRQVIEDDTWQTVPILTMKAKGVDKEHPRTEVEIDGL